jgi:serine O-acetyltransferase
MSKSKINDASAHRLEISASVPDWDREALESFWDPSRQLLAAMRAYQKARNRKGVLAATLRKLAVLRHRFWQVVTGADIPINARIDGGLRLPHPNGIVVHPDARLGPNCILFQQVTIGTSPGENPPRLGGHVDVMAGAKIVGDVTIGDHALIGANAVVVSDIPDGAIAVGIPAKVIGSRFASDDSQG